MKKQTIEVKGSKHPDTLADRFAEVAIDSMEEFDSSLYGNFDKSYLKGGKFPEFTIQGYLSFDFREFSKEYRYELFNHIKNDVVSDFKSIFSEPVIKIKFNLNFEPSNKTHLLKENLYTDTAFITGIRKFSEFEDDIMLLSSYIDDIEDIESDYKLLLLDGEKLYINQTFYTPDDLFYEGYVRNITDYVRTLSSLKDLDISFNPDKEEAGIFFSRYGSSLFYNSSGNVGRGNQWYGFNSPERMWGETPYGKHRLHPAKYLVNVARNHVTHQKDAEQYMLFGEMGDRLDNYKYTIK